MFTFEAWYPPATINLVLLPPPADACLTADKSPKSVAFPADSTIIFWTVFTTAESSCPPANKPTLATTGLKLAVAADSGPLP